MVAKLTADGSKRDTLPALLAKKYKTTPPADAWQVAVISIFLLEKK
jgi:hypothetical protein